MAASLATISALITQRAYSDPLTGGTLTQRIGNVDVELKTVPENPLPDKNTMIFLRFGNIDGDDLMDTPVNIKITKQGEEVHRTETVTIPDGHYTYSYRFVEPDIYGIIVEIESHPLFAGSMSSSNSSESATQSLLFTFPIIVNSELPLGLSSFQISLVIGISITIFAIFFFYRRVVKKPTPF